jgi:hypothetical protein
MVMLQQDIDFWTGKSKKEKSRYVKVLKGQINSRGSRSKKVVKLSRVDSHFMESTEGHFLYLASKKYHHLK